MVKLKGSDKVFAMKILNKWEMLSRQQVSRISVPLASPTLDGM